MPLLKYSEVLAYSSEDPNHPVENLLKPDAYTYLKWKSKNGHNQKQEYAILKLEKLSTIKSIDIGNENSAFVEILASREGTDYQVLLVASSFMTPLEARNGTNLNRVRMFGSDKLNKDIADQKWDRLKIICTQPFNKMCQYGLTFIKAYGPDDKASSDVSDVALGKYSLKEMVDDEDSIEVGSFFEKRNQKEKESLVGSAAIRAASKASVITPQKRTLEDEVASPSVEKQINKRHKASPTPAAKHISKPEKPRTKEKDNSPQVVKPPKNGINSKEKDVRPFNQLMKEVVFVLSGYQNPKRSQLRDHLIAMGAKYKQDWEKGCTHLICAFKNTPKYTSVKGKGKIVKGDWVEECYKKKTRLPWRRFNLESNKNAEESEEEILAAEICSTDKVKDAGEEHSHDSEDTDDELQRALDEKDKSEDSRSDCDKKSPPVKQVPSRPPSDDDYGADTDVDEEDVPEKKDTSSLPLPPLKTFLKGLTFFIYGNIEESKKKALTRYITAFQGKIYDYMDSKVKYVLTDESWDENFDEALTDNPSLQFVKSQWLWKCCDKEKFVPPQPFLIVPAEED